MPLRPMNREQAWLLPPTLDDLLPKDHPARFVAVFVDGLDHDAWAGMEIDVDGDPLGSPAYHPRALLSVWLYGFMTGIRSSRKLEAACRDQISFLWLTGWQRPDHNTLWRFYQAHRTAMRSLLKHTVRTAVQIGLVDLAMQALDGTKIAANAAGDRTFDAAGLERLLVKTEAAIGDLEAQNEGGDDPPPPRLPAELLQAQVLRERIQHAMNHLAQDQSLRRVNLTDEDAQLMKGRQGILPAYNAQAVVSPLDPARAQRSGLLITAADVTTAPDDYGQLAPMLDQAQEMTGEQAEVTLADGGYHSGPNLRVCDERSHQVVMPEGQREAMKGPYFKDRFEYDSATDSYICPQGQRLIFRGLRRHKSEAGMKVYRASGAVCRVCPAFGVCTKDRRWGRVLWISPYDALLRNHRRWMATTEAKEMYARRKQLVEPSFGILKEQMGARRLLLRGLANVKAEFVLLATAFNLRTLWRVWAGWQGPPPSPYGALTSMATQSGSS